MHRRLHRVVGVIQAKIGYAGARLLDNRRASELILRRYVLLRGVDAAGYRGFAMLTLYTPVFEMVSQ